MTTVETMIYMLTEYNKGSYTTADFCDIFEIYYRNLELPPLPSKTEEWLDKLDELCGRFSEFPEDHALCSDAFVNENVIRAYMKTCPDEVLSSLSGAP